MMLPLPHPHVEPGCAAAAVARMTSASIQHRSSRVVRWRGPGTPSVGCHLPFHAALWRSPQPDLRTPLGVGYRLVGLGCAPQGINVYLRLLVFLPVVYVRKLGAWFCYFSPFSCLPRAREDCQNLLWDLSGIYDTCCFSLSFADMFRILTLV